MRQVTWRIPEGRPQAQKLPQEGKIRQKADSLELNLRVYKEYRQVSDLGERRKSNVPSIDHAKSKLHTRTMWLFSGNAESLNVVPHIVRDERSLSPDLITSESPVPDGVFPQDFSEEYEVIEPIGEGAICNVYAVRNKKMDRRFALKVLKEEFTSNQAALKQFRKEVNAAVSLTHFNVAAVYGHGQTATGSPFVVQHLCEGNSLADIIQRNGRLDSERAAKIFMQICDAMSHAHMKAVIHRDLKPSNVVVTSTPDGDVVHLIDFGMSTVLQAARVALVDVTRTGEVFGTPHYMSPEQCLGEKVDARSDIYSFGCLMFEALNGRPPFIGVNPVQVIVRHLKEDPPPFESCMSLADVIAAPRLEDGTYRYRQLPQLERIVMRCMKKDPAERYQTFDEIRADLENMLSGVNLPASERETFPSLRRCAVASAVDGVLIGSTLFPLVLFYPLLTSAAFQLQSLASIGNGAQYFQLPMLSSLFWFSPEFLSFVCFNSIFGPNLIAIVCPWYAVLFCLYHAVFESSPLRGTLGMRIAGVQVVDEHGDRITFLHSMARFWLRMFWPYCVIIEHFILKRRIGSRFNPIDRISKSYVVTRTKPGRSALCSINFPSPIPKTMALTHWAYRKVGDAMLSLFGALAVVFFSHVALGVPYPNIGILIMVACALVTGAIYQSQLAAVKRRLLLERKERMPELSFTAIFLRSLRRGKTQTKGS